MSASEHPDTSRVLADIALERDRQIDKGWTRGHDDTHQTHQLVTLAKDRIPRPGSAGHGLYSRERLIEGIAILVAAVEAMDRRGDTP